MTLTEGRGIENAVSVILQRQRRQLKKIRRLRYDLIKRVFYYMLLRIFHKILLFLNISTGIRNLKTVT